jgi:acetyl-CoA carboxylase biotin carboxyl carrier protein
MDIKKISELIELINNTNIGEIEIHEGGSSVRITRQSPAPASVVMHMPQTAPQQAPIMPANNQTPVAAEISGHTVRSPMVGTVYLAPNPGAKSFVEIGQTVKTGDVLCIVEAMKIMNEIESEFSGEIVEICVENENYVEYGQVLFRIKS